MSPTILVTGGAGFIGSHTCVALLAAGYTPLLLDNLGNSDARVVDRLARITGTAPRLVVPAPETGGARRTPAAVRARDRARGPRP